MLKKKNAHLGGDATDFTRKRNKASFRSVDSSTVIIRPSATAWVTGAAGLQQVGNDPADDQLMTISVIIPSPLLFNLFTFANSEKQIAGSNML